MKKRELLYVKNGAIDLYYGLRIETKLPYAKMCNNIREKVANVFHVQNDNIRNVFTHNIKEAADKCGISALKVKCADWPDTEKHPELSSISKDDISGIEFKMKPRGFSICGRTILEDYLSQAIDDIEGNYTHNREIYGEYYVNAHALIPMSPIKIKLKNGSSTLLHVMLFLFKNKMGVLRMTLPIDNLDTIPLTENNIDNYIACAETFQGFPVPLLDKSIGSIAALYYQFLTEVKKITSVVPFKNVVNIILANHSKAFDSVDNVPEELKEDIYKICAAPIHDMPGFSYKQDAIKHFADLSYRFKGLAYVIGTMGKCVSIIDKTFVKSIGADFSNIQALNWIIKEIRRNVEFTIIILLLKNINNGYIFDQSISSSNNLYKTNNDYNMSKIFISLLKSGVYGSVRELTTAFEEKMTYFLDEENVSDRINAMNNILDGEQSRRTIRLENILSVGGLLFTIIFGLPAINETLAYIRAFCSFIEINIPIISIKNCSIIIWGTTIVYLTAFLLFNRTRRKI